MSWSVFYPRIMHACRVCLGKNILGWHLLLSSLPFPLSYYLFTSPARSNAGVLLIHFYSHYTAMNHQYRHHYHRYLSSITFLLRHALQCKTRFCARMSSVCPSVCLSVCDVGGSGPHRLEILQTNCTNNQPNTFALRSHPPYSHLGTMGKFWGD